MLEILSFDFFQNALLAALAVSIVCGAIGTLVMINRLFSMAGGITHGAFGGIGIALFFNLPIFLSTGVFTLFLALLLAFLSEKFQNRIDNFIAVIWAFGMALGIILIDLTPGYSADLMAYLFGNILAVSKDDLALMFGVDFVIILLLICFFRQFEALSFDSEFARLKGVYIRFFHYLLVAMIALCIVVCIRLVGIILVMALLSIPCLIAESFSKKLGFVMLIAIFLSCVFCASGLVISYYFNTSSGASIIFVSCIFFALNLAYKAFKK